MLDIRPAPDHAAPLEHGGDLAAVRARFAHAPQPWIDLSTGINPYPFPVGELPAACFARLPEPARLRALERAAARAYSAHAPHVVAAAGAQALIQFLPRALAGERIGMLGPTYEEHALAWRRAGRDVRMCVSLDELEACDIAVIVNPNNPTGRIIARNDLLALARHVQLVVDESFADFTPQASIADVAGETGAIVLRSFGKTFGLAGLRLGFAIAPRGVAEDLRAAAGPWPVNGPAIEIGVRALADSPWLDASREKLAASAARLDDLLARAGCTIDGGTPLFRLVAHPDAAGLADRLARAGIHVRRFGYRPDWLRFGLPADEAWARLEDALLAQDAAR